MPTVYKVLGQAAPVSLLDTNIYTVPAATQVIISSITVCNRGTDDATFRVWVAVNSVVTANNQYIYYDVPIAGNDTFIATVGITIDAADQVRVRGGGTGGSNLTFQLFGSEIT
jgi:hypothetical protein